MMVRRDSGKLLLSIYNYLLHNSTTWWEIVVSFYMRSLWSFSIIFQQLPLLFLFINHLLLFPCYRLQFITMDCYEMSRFFDNWCYCFFSLPVWIQLIVSSSINDLKFFELFIRFDNTSIRSSWFSEIYNGRERYSDQGLHTRVSRRLFLAR